MNFILTAATVLLASLLGSVANTVRAEELVKVCADGNSLVNNELKGTKIQKVIDMNDANEIVGDEEIKSKITDVKKGLSLKHLIFLFSGWLFGTGLLSNDIYKAMNNSSESIYNLEKLQALDDVQDIVFFEQNMYRTVTEIVLAIVSIVCFICSVYYYRHASGITNNVTMSQPTFQHVLDRFRVLCKFVLNDEYPIENFCKLKEVVINCRAAEETGGRFATLFIEPFLYFASCNGVKLLTKIGEDRRKKERVCILLWHSIAEGETDLGEFTVYFKRILPRIFAQIYISNNFDDFYALFGAYITDPDVLRNRLEKRYGITEEKLVNDVIKDCEKYDKSVIEKIPKDAVTLFWQFLFVPLSYSADIKNAAYYKDFIGFYEKLLYNVRNDKELVFVLKNMPAVANFIELDLAEEKYSLKKGLKFSGNDSV